MGVSHFKGAGGRSGLAEPMRDGPRAVCRSVGWATGRPPDTESLADSTLYTGLDDVAEEQTHLFRCPEQDVPVLPPQPCL